MRPRLTLTTASLLTICARLPTTTACPGFFSAPSVGRTSGSISRWRRVKSSNVDAPSASAKRIRWPREKRMPWGGKVSGVPGRWKRCVFRQKRVPEVVSDGKDRGSVLEDEISPRVSTLGSRRSTVRRSSYSRSVHGLAIPPRTSSRLTPQTSHATHMPNRPALPPVPLQPNHPYLHSSPRLPLPLVGQFQPYVRGIIP